MEGLQAHRATRNGDTIRRGSRRQPINAATATRANPPTTPAANRAPVPASRDDGTARRAYQERIERHRATRNGDGTERWSQDRPTTTRRLPTTVFTATNAGAPKPPVERVPVPQPYDDGVARGRFLDSMYRRRFERTPQVGGEFSARRSSVYPAPPATGLEGPSWQQPTGSQGQAWQQTQGQQAYPPQGQQAYQQPPQGQQAYQQPPQGQQAYQQPPQGQQAWGSR
jgi:hypothetical protein